MSEPFVRQLTPEIDHRSVANGSVSELCVRSERRLGPDPALIDEVAHTVPEVVLAVGAHPDDVDVIAGGTLALWAGAGARVVYCVVTDGDAGGFDPAVSRDAIRGIRRDEQAAAAAEIGAAEVVFLGYKDGDVRVTQELRRDLAGVIRRVRPDRVVCHSPERLWYGPVNTDHPDHFAAGEATLCAVYPDARNLFAHPELAEQGLEPHHVNDVWLAGAGHTDVVVDITDTIGAKVAAMGRHASQLPKGAEAFGRRLTEAAGLVGEAHGLGDARLGEEFRVIITAENRVNRATDIQTG